MNGLRIVEQEPEVTSQAGILASLDLACLIHQPDDLVPLPLCDQRRMTFGWMGHHIHSESLARSQCSDFEVFGIAMATKRLRSIGEALAWRNHFESGCGKGIRNRTRITATCVSKP
jgi:hypothetical protein